MQISRIFQELFLSFPVAEKGIFRRFAVTLFHCKPAYDRAEYQGTKHCKCAAVKRRHNIQLQAKCRYRSSDVGKPPQTEKNCVDNGYTRTPCKAETRRYL